ncbi:MAG: hypothetical protein K6T30_08325 [Alicyclobacillus sp.]|nr:hypothetical protein [Alicyclobacillus sp.]
MPMRAHGTLERYTAVFVRLVHVGRRPARTLALLLDVRDAAGRLARDHAWIQDGRPFARVRPRLRSGEKVEFYAFSAPYRRRKRGSGGAPCIGFVVEGPVLRFDALTVAEAR